MTRSLPDQPPTKYFEDKGPAVKESLRKAHPDWSESKLDQMSRATLADVWYHKLTPEERVKLTKQYEGESDDAETAVKAIRASDFGEMNKFTEPGTEPANIGQDDGDIAPVEAKVLTEKERDKLPDQKFAYPEGQKLPINDAEHVRNALARFNQTDLPADKKGEVLGRICSAAKKFGIESELCKSRGKAEATDTKIHFPSHRFFYTAEPKFGGEQGDILMKAIVLEPGLNVNGWEVDEPEFGRVADAYKAGRQLRLDHDKEHVSSVFGKSFNGQVMSGKDAANYLGHDVPGLDPEGTVVVADFVATPMDPQVRTNIMKGYVETCSIGLDANAFCKACDQPVTITADGSVNRSCTDLNAGIVLRNVDVKEYSYVSEPAFPHAMLYPSFSAAVSATLGSSLSISSRKTEASMSQVSKVEAKTAEPKEESVHPQIQMDADAYAEQRMNDYKRGLADAAKFRAAPGDTTEQDEASAKANAEGDGRTEAKASKDQVATTNKTGTKSVAQSAKDDLIARVTRPTEYAFRNDPAMIEIFKAAVQDPKAPSEVKSKLGGVFR